jgi:DNA-directed RNA polymerase III subunit RPC1
MTLKTFHFAGVASMNVTLGVPRIKEIINASKNISTPIITANLVNSSDSEHARVVKSRIEKTYLKEITQYIEEVFMSDECCIIIRIDLERIRLLKVASVVFFQGLKLHKIIIFIYKKLELNVYSIIDSILNSKLKIKSSQIINSGEKFIKINPGEKGKALHGSILKLKNDIGNVVVKVIENFQIIFKTVSSNLNNFLGSL